MTKNSTSFVESTATPWFGVTTFLLGVIIGYAFATLVPGGTQMAPSPTPTPVAQVPKQADPTPGTVRAVDVKNDWIRGNPKAPISLIEWSDYECPFCARHHPTTKTILEKYPDDVNLVFRHYPLSFHPSAQKSAEAAECAGSISGNDAFWKYTDILFEKGAKNEMLETYAAEIGLNATKFKTCLDSGKFAAKVSKDQQDGSAAGVNGTPGNIVINNKTGKFVLVSGAQPASAFDTAIASIK